MFLFAKEVGGSPRPIAARRLSVNELPLTVTLSNNDALMGGQLHPGLRVEIMARLTQVMPLEVRGIDRWACCPHVGHRKPKLSVGPNEIVRILMKLSGVRPNHLAF